MNEYRVEVHCPNGDIRVFHVNAKHVTDMDSLFLYLAPDECPFDCDYCRD